MITDRIKWLGHAAFRVDGEKTLYFDPYKIDKGKKADIIFISHMHGDHCSCEDIEKIVKPETVIITEKDSAKKISHDNIVVLKPYDEYEIYGISVKAVPAYNINKPHHPKQNGWLGFVIHTEGLSIYHSGDTDDIPEMKDINVDVALIPVFPGDIYVMSPKQAANATYLFNAKVTIPMHYGTIGGDLSDVKEMQKDANPKTIVHIMKPVKNEF